MTMQLGIGKDLGLVLCKGIICSLITVFLLMPGLLYMFSNAIDKTVHKNYVPDISFLGKDCYENKVFRSNNFALVIVSSIFLSSMCQYAFDQDSVSSPRLSDSKKAENKIKENFDVGGRFSDSAEREL